MPIRIFLADGEPTGNRLAEISNCTGKVLVAPRSQLDQLSKREAVRRTSVCLLVGPRGVAQRWCETRRSGDAPRDRRFLDPRHTHTMQLLRAGVKLRVVGEGLGCADVAVTLQTYPHVRPDMQHAAVVAMDRLRAHE